MLRHVAAEPSASAEMAPYLYEEWKDHMELIRRQQARYPKLTL